jgi:glutathione S-transferase
MALTLYDAHLSPFTTRVRIQIRAKGLENEIQITPRPAIDAYRAITPIGKIPSLDVGGFVLPESETIAEFIEDSYPEPSLRGHTAIGKAKVRLLARLADLYLMPSFGILFGQMQKRDPERVKEGLEGVSKALDYIEHYLEGPRYATQNRLTLADCALAPAMFFSTAIQPAFGQKPFEGHDKAASYFKTLVAEDALVGQAVEEMSTALKAFMSGNRGG